LERFASLNQESHFTSWCFEKKSFPDLSLAGGGESAGFPSITVKDCNFQQQPCAILRLQDLISAYESRRKQENSIDSHKQASASSVSIDLARELFSTDCAKVL